MSCSVTIDKTLFNTYSQIRLGVLEFSAEVRPSDDRFWAHMHEDVLPQVKAAIEGREWSEIPGIRGSRAAYKAFGRNPGRYRVSSEALLRRVRRDDELYHINSVVDVNNLISVKSGLSLGSYDADRLCGGIVLRKAGAGEGYNGIGKEFLDLENLLVLSDDEGIFGSSMSDSTRAMVTESTKNVLVVIYCFEDDIDLVSLLDETAAVFAEYARAEGIQKFIVNK